jgi:hypothetical protein
MLEYCFSIEVSTGWKAAKSTGSDSIRVCVVAVMSEIKRSSRSKDMLSRTTTRKISILSSFGGSG